MKNDKMCENNCSNVIVTDCEIVSSNVSTKLNTNDVCIQASDNICGNANINAHNEIILYECEDCGTKFPRKSNYRRHVESKRLCIPKDKYNKQKLELKMDKSRLQYFQTTVVKLKKENEKKEDEIVRLKKMLNKIDTISDKIDIANRKIDLTNEKLEEANDKLVLDKFNSAYNNCVINNNNNNNNLNFSVKLAPENCSRFDHISKQQMLHILNNEVFENSVGDLAEAVYFNPKAPENMTWCVTDKTAQFGALEYNPENHTLIRKMTNKVITKNIQNMLFGMTDILEELRLTCSFNERQGMNYTRFYNMVGSHSFKIEYINNVKERAYSGRNFAKALWDQLQVTLEKTDLNHRHVSKSN